MSTGALEKQNPTSRSPWGPLGHAQRDDDEKIQRSKDGFKLQIGYLPR
jgi:hypothetical protein